MLTLFLNMSSVHIRQRKTVNYFYRPEEPAFDEYVYCEKCADFVFEFCSIHGPLLVVPDNKVSLCPNFPSIVPRAALTIPHVFLHLAPSVIPGAGIGVFSTLTLPRGVRFGPYRGQRTNEVTSMYCWQIHSRSHCALHVVDAADGAKSNWMRYVNCARHWREQNLVAFQYRGQLYYRTVKTIPPFTELMVFYGSEYANVLNIDLGMYSAEQYYQHVVETSYNYQESMGIFKRTSTTTDHKNNIDNNENSKFDTEIKVSDNETVTESKENYFEKCGELIDDEEKMQHETITGTEKNVFLSFKNDFEECGEFNKGDEMRYHVITDEDRLPIADRAEDTTVFLNKEFNYKKTWKCEKCQKVLSNKTTRSRHYATHEVELQCPKCHFQTDNKSNFKYHLLSHEDKVYKCELCEYICTVKKYMNRHQKRHVNNIYP